MTQPLPPDLDKLGDALAAATERAARERRRRRDLIGRLVATGVASVLAFTVLNPGALGPADRSDGLLSIASAEAYVPQACETPRGATFSQSQRRPCAAPGVTDVESLERPYAAR